jgi:hypothetical protein
VITSNGYVLDESERRLGALNPVPPDQRRDRAALWNRLRSDGYLYLPNFLPREMVLAFREYYFDEMKETGLTTTDPGADPGVAGAGPIDRGAIRTALFDRVIPGYEYETLTGQPTIRDWFHWLLDDDVHLHKRRIIRHILPGESGIGTATQAHYDLVYLREGSERVLSMWIPIGDCPIELGGLAYLERSHHWVMAEERSGTLKRPAASITANLPALADEHDSRWLMANYQAGDVVVHSSYIVHASTDNVDPANRIRLSTDFRYQRSSEAIDWRWQEYWHEDDGL